MEQLLEKLLQLLNGPFHDQWVAVMSAPRVMAPLLLIALFIGWKLKEIIDDAEKRALREQKNVTEDRLLLAKDQIAWLEATRAATVGL